MPVARMGQYIGAKVTPSFFENPLDGTNDWVQGITYEELTVVTYDSKLYISKKPVRDITVVPTDTEYWLEYPSGGGGSTVSFEPIEINGTAYTEILNSNCYIETVGEHSFLILNIKMKLIQAISSSAITPIASTTALLLPYNESFANYMTIIAGHFTSTGTDGATQDTPSEAFITIRNNGATIYVRSHSGVLNSICWLFGIIPLN